MNAFNDANVIASLAWVSINILIVIGGGFKFFFTIKHRLDNIENYTYKRNGGSSMADALARLEAALKENTKLTQQTAKEVAKLEGRFENHIEEGK